MNKIPKLDLFGHIEASKFSHGIKLTSTQGNFEETPKLSFKGVMGELVQNMNNDLQKPDNMLVDLMNGNPNVDIHDVMTAMAKAELGVSVAAQITTKVISAYDRISQIQV